MRRPYILYVTAILFGLLFFDSPAYAQCRVGSGPDHHDGIPYCSSVPQQPAPVRPQAWVNVFAAVAMHPNANDIWAVWDVRDEQGGSDGANKLALDNCAKTMGAGCFIAADVQNASIGIARDVRGFHWAAYGETHDVARSNVIAKCVKATSDSACQYIKTITAKPWREYTDVAGINALNDYNPKGKKVHGRFASATVVDGAKEPWSTRIWVSSGQATPAEATRLAQEKCQADSMSTCTANLINMDGYYVIYRNENGEYGIITARNLGDGKKEMQKICESQSIKCTILKIIDAKVTSLEIVDSKLKY